MKNRLKTHQLILLAVLIALILACGAVVAYMFQRTAETNLQFAPAEVTCKVTTSEATDSSGNLTISSIQVKNTGNIDAYLRVRLVPYWYDSANDALAAKTPPPDPDATLVDDVWEEGSDYTYYYVSPVSAGSTVELLKMPVVLTASSEGYHPKVDFLAEAIQANPGTAVTSSWGVTLDSNGYIVSAP